MQNLPYSNTAPVEFNFSGHLLRTFNEGDAIWFVAKDVCDALGIANVSQACANLDDDEKLVYVLHISGQNREGNTICKTDSIPRGNPNLLCVNESGLYALILRSNKPQAKPFRKWVTGEVLPTIRKTGSYGNSTLPAFILDTRLSAPQKIILLILAHQADAQGKCQISFSKLARISSVDSSWVIKSIYHLVANGFLSVSKTQNRNGSAGVNIYTVPEQCRVHGQNSTYQLSEAQYNQLQATKHLINALADLNLHHKQ
jgi:prophage antirepressor-like protein